MPDTPPTVAELDQFRAWIADPIADLPADLSDGAEVIGWLLDALGHYSLTLDATVAGVLTERQCGEALAHVHATTRADYERLMAHIAAHPYDLTAGRRA